MLQAMNDRIKGCLGIAIVIVIGISFALWGVQSYFSDAAPKYAASVNGVEISAREFQQMVSRQRQSLSRQYGGKLPIEEKVLLENTLSQLIDRQLLESAAFDNGYRISNSVLSAKIQQQFTVGGVFNREAFEANVASLGMTPSMYENVLRAELRRQQMQSAIANSSFVTAGEIASLSNLNDQTRDIYVMTFNVDHFSTAAKATEEEVKQYYDANIDRFMVPEKIKVDYVEVVSESLAENIKVDEESITKMYDDYVVSISGREERLAQHILLQFSEDKAADKAKLESIKQELENGADFSELAKKHSQDGGSAEDGGDLGWLALGEMAKPFEQALFDIEKNALSDIVETQYGYHLIKLNDIRSELIESFDVKRDEFEEELKADGVASAFYDLSERLASISYENPDNLDLIIEDLGLKLISSDFFQRDKGEGIAVNEKVRNIAFSSLVLEQGSNSDIIEINAEHVVVVRLNEHQPAIAIPLQVVSSNIENILRLQNSRQQTKAAAMKVKAKIEAGESIASQQTEGIKIETVEAVGRKDTAKVSSPAILHSAFEIAPKQSGAPAMKVVDLPSGDVALIALTKVNSPSSIAQERLDVVKQETVRSHATRDFSNTLLSFKNKADIDINQRIIEK